MSESPDDLLVGTPERERAAALLNDALAGGYLDLVEFDRRVTTVYAARSRGELQEALTALPTAGRLFGSAGSGTELHRVQPGSIGVPPTDAINISWTTISRKGVWEVAPRMSVTGSMGTLQLNFAAARFPVLDVLVEVQVNWSTIKIRVPDGVRVESGDLNKSGWSSVKDKSGPVTTAAGPIITLIGDITTSSVIITRS